MILQHNKIRNSLRSSIHDCNEADDEADQLFHAFNASVAFAGVHLFHKFNVTIAHLKSVNMPQIHSQVVTI